MTLPPKSRFGFIRISHNTLVGRMRGGDEGGVPRGGSLFRLSFLSDFVEESGRWRRGFSIAGSRARRRGVGFKPTLSVCLPASMAPTEEVTGGRDVEI